VFKITTRGDVSHPQRGRVNFLSHVHPVLLNLSHLEVGNLSDQSCVERSSIVVHLQCNCAWRLKGHSTYTHTPELALTSLNVNIYYLCTDHDTSDAPCWLRVRLVSVCESVCVCVCVHWF